MTPVRTLTTADFPVWLTVLSSASLVLAAATAVWTIVDLRRRPQSMAIMNAVWPLTMLFGSVLWLALYRRWGRSRVRRTSSGSSDETPLAASVAVGASHCGAGCALGDVIAEFSVALIPGLAVALGLGTLFEHELFAGWILDFVVAYLLGILFQYFAIAPARGLSPGKGILEAVKADTLSITAWQIGMYGLMAVGQFAIFVPVFGATASPLSPEFWFMMQFAMLGGFATAYPVNWWLIRVGVKERM